MKLTNSVKKQITKDWANCFPSLGIYRSMWLMRRNGPLAVGICLDRDSGNEAYRPTFHVHNLSKPSSAVTLTLMQPLLTTKTKVPETIKAEYHYQHFEDAAARLCRQIPIELTDKMRIDEILKAYYLYLEHPFGRYPLFLFEDIISLLLWGDKFTQAERALRDFSATVRAWPESINVLILQGGSEKWVAKCQGWINNPKQLRDCVDSQTKIHKLEALPYSNLLE